MRWFKKLYYIGEHRIIKRFLIFPKFINQEYRWLETATIKQTYNPSYMRFSNWEDIEWIDESKADHV